MDNSYEQGSHRAGLAVMTLKEIADRWGISKMRAQQIEASALAKLRRSPIIRQLAVEHGVIGEDEQ